MFLHPEAPGAVGENHELSDKQVERRAATAALDADERILALAFKREEPVDTAHGFGTAPDLLAVLLKLFGKAPEPADLVRELNVERARLNRLLGHERVDLVVAQIARDAHALKPRLGLLNGEGLVVHRHVEREAGHRTALVKRKGLDPRIGKHRRLEPRRIDRAHAGAGHLVERIVAQNAERRRGDVNAHSRATALEMHDARRVINLGRVGVVDGKGPDVRKRILRPVRLGRQRQVGGEAAALREVHGVEAVDVPAPWRGDAAEREHQAQRRLARFGGGVVQGLPLDTVLVRPNEKRHGVAADDVRKRSLHHLGRPSLALLLQTALLLKCLERLLKDVLGGAAVAAAALSVEVDGIAVERPEKGGLFNRAGRAAPVVGCKVRVRELTLGRNLPQEGGIELGHHGLSTGHEVCGSRLLELEERVRGLDLRPASRRELHLIGVACLAEHGARLEGAVFFKKEIHESVALHPLWANE